MYILLLLLQLPLAAPNSFEQLRARGRNELRQAQYSTAERTLRAALNEAERLKINDAALSIVINDLAEVCRRIGEYREADSLYKRAVTILRKHPESSYDLVLVLNNQGTMYREMGLDFRAAAAFDEATAIARKARLERDPVIGAFLKGMAAANSSKKGDLKDAERYLEQSLRIREAVLGPDHLDVGETLNNLAVVQHGRKQYAKAESAFRRALAISEKHLGPDHPDVAMTLNNLGVSYYQRQRYDAAEQALSRALDIRRRKLPAGHSSIAESLFELAQVMIHTGRPSEAQTFLEEAAAIRSRDLNADSVATLEQYAAVLRLNGHTAKADTTAARAKSMRAQLMYLLKR